MTELELPWQRLKHNPLPARAGGRQRRQLRRTFDYPKGNEPKPWSKRSKKKQMRERYAKVS